MSDENSGRAPKGVLGSLKTILNDRQHDSKAQMVDEDSETHQPLERTMSRIKVQKLKQIFIDKISRSNIFIEPVKFKILSQQQKDDLRIFKCQGFDINEYIQSFVFIFDIIMTLVTFVLGSFLSFLDDFRNGDANSTAVTVLMILAIIATSLKVIVSSIGKTIQDGILLTYISDIVTYYFTSMLVFVDITIVVIYIISLATSHDHRGLGIAIFVISIIKLFTLYENLRVIQTTFINSFKKQQYWNLVKVAFFNIFFAHFLASLLFAMSRIDLSDNWLVANGIDTEVWYVQYVWGFYWATTIMMTVGFGDFLPVTFREAAIVAFLQLFSCIVLAYNISQIGNIIGAIRSSQIDYRRKIAIFKRMCKQDQIDGDLQRRIQAFLKEQTTIKQKFEYNQQAQLITELPQNLQHEYIVESNKTLFPDLPFFNNLQKSTLIQFTQSFKGSVFYPGEYITKMNEANNQIMILKNGKVGLAFKKYGSRLNGTVVQEINISQRAVMNQNGEYYKKITPILLNTDFLSIGSKINYDIVALKYSFIFHIDEAVFFSLIKKSEIDSSYFFSIKHKHSIIKHEWEQLQCYYCTRKEDDPKQQEKKKEKDDKSQKKIPNQHIIYHTKFDCPKLHYFPLNGIVILRSIKAQGIWQNRETSFSRKKKMSPISLSLRKQFFKPYQKARNLTFAQKDIYQENRQHREPEKEKEKWFNLHNKQNHSSNKNYIADMQNDRYKEKNYEQENVEQYRTLEKVVKQAIQEAITGYKPEFWDLELDSMHNYSNYFPSENARNLDLVQLGKGKSSKHSYKYSNNDKIKQPLLKNNKENLLNSVNRLSQSSVM